MLLLGSATVAFVCLLSGSSMALPISVSLVSLLLVLFSSQRISVYIGDGKPTGDREDETGPEANLEAAAARGVESGGGMGRGAVRAAAGYIYIYI